MENEQIHELSWKWKENAAYVLQGGPRADRYTSSYGTPYKWPTKTWVTGAISPLQVELFHPIYNW